MELRPTPFASRLGTIAAWVLGGIFLYAGLVKVSSSHRFLLALMPFLGGGDWLGLVANTLPWMEIVAGLLMFTPWRRFGAAMILLLCLIFTGVLAWALANGIIVDCGCFGRDETPSAWKMAVSLGRDVLLAAVAVYVLYRPAPTSAAGLRQSGH